MVNFKLEIEINSEHENKLLQRIEYTARISHMSESTPSRVTTRDKLAAHVNADKDRTLVINIRSDYGGGQSKVNFRVYESNDQMMKIELPYLLKRNGLLIEES